MTSLRPSLPPQRGRPGAVGRGAAEGAAAGSQGARRSLMFVVGATLSALLLALPAVYLHRWEGVVLPTTLAAWSALPAVGLVLAVARPRPAWTLGLYPASHLPALTVAPALVGPRVFGGPQGALATLVVAMVAWTWVELAAQAALPVADRRAARRLAVSPGMPDLPGGRWAWGARRAAALFGLGVVGAFWAPALVQRDAEPRAAVLSLLVGAVVVWYAVAALSPRRLDRVLLRERAARAAVGELFLESQARPRALAWALVATGLAGALVALWMLG